MVSPRFDYRYRDRRLMASPASGNSRWVRLPNILRRPIDFADPPQIGIVDQFTADHVFAIDEDDRFVLRGNLGKRRLLVHAKIVKAEPSLGVHVVEICLERDHDGFHRSGLGTGLSSGTLRIASNSCGVKPDRS